MTCTPFRVVTIDGTTASTEWDTTGSTLRLLQDAVGGFVDVVTLHPTIDMWVNDTGLVDALPTTPTPDPTPGGRTAVAPGGTSCRRPWELTTE